MSIWKESIKRSNGESIRKEDNLTPVINEFFDSQKQVKSFNIRRIESDWYVDVDGTVHIYPRDLDKGGMLAFSLGNVSGNLICHTKSINPALLPANLGGEIIFETEDICAACTFRQNAGQAQQCSANTNSQPQQDYVPDGFDGMEQLRATPPKESDVRKKMESLISDSIEYGFDIDIESIRKAILEEKNNPEKYKLRFNVVYAKKRRWDKKESIVRFDIYLSDNDDDILELPAINKAIYIAFLLYNEGNGVVIEEENKDFIDLVTSIYLKLPNKVRDFINKKTIESGNLTVTTFAGYRSEIRNAIKEKLRYNKLINEFAIEGYKSKPFKISKSTEEIRNQIKEVFLIQ